MSEQPTRCLALAFVAAIATVLLTAPSASAQEALAASCEPPRESTAIISGGGSATVGETSFAQTFTSALTGPLTRAEANVLESGGTTGDYVFQIWSADAGVPAALLATTTVPDSSVPVGDSMVTAVFASPASVVAGNQYALRIARPTATSLAIGTRSNDDCPGRVLIGSPTSPWGVTALDMVFRVYVTPPPPAIASVSPPAVSCGGKRATITGTNRANRIIGTSGPDVIAALGGTDAVFGRGGKDLICGGGGKDLLAGGKAKDKLLGQRGRDTLKGGGGNDACRGGGGLDALKTC